MTEFVVPRSAELGARRVVIVRVAFHPHPVGNPGPGRDVVVQRVPLRARINYSRIVGLLNYVVFGCNKTKIDT